MRIKVVSSKTSQVAGSNITHASVCMIYGYIRPYRKAAPSLKLYVLKLQKQGFYDILASVPFER